MIELSLTTWSLIYLSIGLSITNASEAIVRHNNKQHNVEYDELSFIGFFMLSVFWPFMILAAIIIKIVNRAK